MTRTARPGYKINSNQRRRYSKDVAVLALYDCGVACEHLEPIERRAVIRWLVDKYREDVPELWAVLRREREF